MSEKNVRFGHQLSVDAQLEGNKKVAFFERALENKIVVDRDYLQSIVDSYSHARGESKLAAALLRGEEL